MHLSAALDIDRAFFNLFVDQPASKTDPNSYAKLLIPTHKDVYQEVDVHFFKPELRNAPPRKLPSIIIQPSVPVPSSTSSMLYNASYTKHIVNSSQGTVVYNGPAVWHDITYTVTAISDSYEVHCRMRDYIRWARIPISRGQRWIEIDGIRRRVELAATSDSAPSGDYGVWRSVNNFKLRVPLYIQIGDIERTVTELDITVDNKGNDGSNDTESVVINLEVQTK